MGRIFMRGFVAAAVASKVGSSMSWHMSLTRFSPKGSTSSRAPQWGSQNSPYSGRSRRNWKSMNWGGAPMSSWRFLNTTDTSSPSKRSARCMRFE